MLRALLRTPLGGVLARAPPPSHATMVVELGDEYDDLLAAVRAHEIEWIRRAAHALLDARISLHPALEAIDALATLDDAARVTARAQLTRLARTRGDVRPRETKKRR